jgi:hypothetical protein
MNAYRQKLSAAILVLIAMGLFVNPSHAQRSDRPGSQELQGDVNAYFGPRRPGYTPPQQQTPVVPLTPRTPRTPQPGTIRPPTAWELGRIYQDEGYDPRIGRIVREAAIIHNIRCPNGATIYVYQYIKRPFFRAIRPPNWGQAIGGRDFGTYEEAIRAGCAGA